MPRAVADSDDESDDLLANENSAESTFPLKDNTGNVETPVVAVDGTIEKSTGSTGGY